MRRIDLQPHQIGARCLICEALNLDGKAQLRERHGAGVCYFHFAELLSSEARLRRPQHAEAAAEKEAAAL